MSEIQNVKIVNTRQLKQIDNDANNQPKVFEQYRKQMQELFVIEEKETQKRDLVLKKIELIVGMTKQKLKLIKGRKNDRFNKHFESVKQLSSFVDYSEKIQNLNILNNFGLMKDIKQYQLKKRLSQVQIGPPDKQIVDVQDDPLFQELDYEDMHKYHQDDEDDQTKLKFGNLIKVDLLNGPTIKIRNYIQTRAALQKASIPLRKYYSTQSQQDDKFIMTQGSKISSNQQLSNFEDKLFYNNIENNFQQFGNRILQKEKEEVNEDVSMVQNQNLQQVARSYGIEIDEDAKSILQNNTDRDNKIFSIFKKRSNDIVQQALTQAKQKHAKYLKQKELEAIEENKSRQKDGIQKYSDQIKDKINQWNSDKYDKLTTKTTYNNLITDYQDSTQIKTQSNTYNFLEAQTYRQNKAKANGRSFKIMNFVSLPNTSRSTSFLDQKKNFSPKTMKLSGRNQSHHQSPDIRCFQSQFKSLQYSLQRYETSHKKDYKLLEMTIKELENDVGIMVEKVDDEQQIKNLGITEDDALFSQKFKNQDSIVKKMVRRNNNRAMKMIKYAD